jgi:hypothetical protein
VRGDSLNTLGLESPAGAGLNLGDADRDGLVTLANDIFPALANIGAGGGFGWDSGDFDNDGLVTLANDIFPALAFVGGGASIPPAIGAVPEPSAVCLAVLGLAGIGLAKRRRRN